MSNSLEAAMPGTIEYIKKLNGTGASLEYISRVTGVEPEVVRQLLAQVDDPQYIKDILTRVQQESRRFRCSASGRLMRSPVQAGDNRLCEKQVLETLLKEGQMTSDGSSLAVLVFFREDTRHFSQETLEQIEICIIQKVNPEATLDLVSDCLSVLSPESDLSSFLRVFQTLENSQLPRLLELIHSKSPADLMPALLSRLADIEGFQPTVLAISKLLLSRVCLDFDLFLYVINKAPASSEMMALALEVADLCTSSQFAQLREELFRKNWDSDQWKLDELSFREAEFRVQDGEDAAARELLKTLKGNLLFKNKLLEYFDRVDWKQDKLEFLDEIYSRNMQIMKAQRTSPPLMEVLETLYQITQTGQQVRPKVLVQENPSVNLNLKSALEDLKIQQKAFYANLEVQQRRLQAVQDSVQQFTKNEPSFIYNYQHSTATLHKTDLSTGEVSSTALTHTFKQYSSLCESPDGELYVTGGNAPSDEVVCINPTTNAVTTKPPMKTARRRHGSVFFGGFLYVIGGHNTAYLAECERYDSFQDKWEPIAPLPQASSHHGAIVCGHTRRLYTLGGHNGADLDIIQEFELESQTWKLLEVKLSCKSNCIPYFRAKDQALIYFIQNGALYSFSPSTYALTQVKTVTNIQSLQGACSYANGSLYYPNEAGPLQKLEIGELS
jgi:hypothetical protein